MASRRSYNRLIKFLLTIAMMVSVFFGVLIAWVVTGPRPLDGLTPYFESALAPQGSGYSVKIGHSLLIFDGWNHPIGLRIRNVDILDGNGAAIAHFPEVGVRMYFFKLLRGKVELKSIELLNPTAQLAEDDKGNLTSFGFSSEGTATNAPITEAFEFLASETGDHPLVHLNSFIIRHASLSVKDSHGKPFLSSTDTTIEITRKHGTAKGTFTMPLQFGGGHGWIASKFYIDGNDKSVTSNVTFSNIPSAVLHALAPGQEWMAGVQVPLSGAAQTTSDFNANISAINFTLEAGQGTINFPDQFEKVLHPRHIKLEGALTDQLKTLTVKEGLLEFPDNSIGFSGVVYLQGDDYGVDGYAQTENDGVDTLPTYWPLKLAPHSRHWVTTRLSKGIITKATVNLHFKPGEFKLANTPEAAVDATIAVKGSTVNYKPEHPPVTDVDAVIHFTGRTMDAKVTSARYLEGTRITGGRVRFPDFYPDDVQLILDMDLTAPAKDVQRFLSLPDLNKAARLNLTPDVTGQVKGSAKLDFIAFSENEKDDVSATGRINYSVKADLINVAQNKFLDKRDVADANMKLAVDNKGIKVAGKAKVNGLPMTIDLTTGFGGDNPTTYAIKTEMPIAKLPEFGLPKLDFAKGSMDVNATFYTSDTADKADATLDLTRTAISLPQHGFAKKEGGKATLKLSTQDLPGGNTLIKSFTLTGPSYTMTGSAEYDKAIADFSTFSFSQLRFAKHDLDSLTYSRDDNTIHLSARGRSFDATTYLADNSNRNPDLGFVVDMKTGRLVLGDGRELNDVLVAADCPADHCNSATITAKLKEGTPFYYTIVNGRLTSSCDNAGELARVFAIFDTIEGGKMSMKGQYKAGRLEGDLEVKNYTLKNAPVLTKMFTIASLTGLLDTLVGNGIYFDRMSMPFVFHKGILIVKDVKTHGSALGLTADGVIDTNKSTLDLTGLLIPSYMLNSAVSNIPLINKLVGPGIIALSYGMHGNMKDPSIAVNPLSVLTPGFLREIFNVFDKPVPDMDAIEAANKKAQDAAKAAGKQDNATPVPAPQSPPSSPAPPAQPLPSVHELNK